MIQRLGRFTQQDPIGLMGGGDLYLFAVNIQTWFDVMGLTPNSQPSNNGLYWGRPSTGTVNKAGLNPIKEERC